MAKRYELIHGRDPDSACDIRLLVDGVQVDDEEISIVSFDPGAGYDWTDFKESGQAAITDLSPAAAIVATAFLDSALESRDLDNKPDTQEDT